MSTDLALRHAEKAVLTRLLFAQHGSAYPKEFNEVIAQTEAQMEPEDIELVRKKFEDWKNNL